MTIPRWQFDTDDKLRNSGDTIERHQPAVAALVQDISARIGLPLHGSDLPNAALYHDEGERVVGDIPYGAKRRWPALAAALEVAEFEAMAEMGLPGFPWQLSDEEADVLKLADLAEAWLWAHRVTDTDVPRWRRGWLDVYSLAASISPVLADWWIATSRAQEAAE